MVAVTAVPHNIWSHGGMGVGGVGRKEKEKKRKNNNNNKKTATYHRYFVHTCSQVTFHLLNRPISNLWCFSPLKAFILMTLLIPLISSLLQFNFPLTFSFIFGVRIHFYFFSPAFLSKLFNQTYPSMFLLNPPCL